MFPLVYGKNRVLDDDSLQIDIFLGPFGDEGEKPRLLKTCNIPATMTQEDAVAIAQALYNKVSSLLEGNL